MNYECLESGLATQTEGDSNVVHGVALGVEDETNGASGKTTEWPAAVLEEAAEKFEGVPIVKDHPNIEQTEDGLKITGQAPIESKVGEVTRAKYKEDVGVLWEGEITDEEMLSKVQDGIAEVSPVLKRKLKEVEDGQYQATGIEAVRDIGLVSKGAAESNTIEPGAAAMSAEALAEEFGGEALKEVAGVEFTGRDTGKLDESEIPNDDYEDHYLYPADTKSESGYPVVDADGNLRKGNVEAAWQLGCRGKCDSAESHDTKLKNLAKEFDDVPEWAENDSESMAEHVSDPRVWEACSVAIPQHDDGADEPSPQSSVADDSEETMTETDLSDTEKAILEAAESVEEPVEALEEYAATEGPTIVAQDDYEALQARVDEVRGVLEESLSERTELKEETIEALSFEALCSEFEDDDGELQVEALTQEPETGDPDETEEAGIEALREDEDADVDKAEALYNDMQEFGVDHEDNIVEALNVEDFDTAEEVLN